MVPSSSPPPIWRCLTLTNLPLHTAWNFAMVFLVRTARLYNEVSPMASTWAAASLDCSGGTLQARLASVRRKLWVAKTSCPQRTLAGLT